MRRDELEHIIRAAAIVAGHSDLVVVGSQAILGQYPDAPAVLLFSQEADLYPRDHPEKAVEIDGALGDGSQFHATFGYYAHGVGPETAKAPLGWQTRLVPVRVSAAIGKGEDATGWCLEAHDLVLAKCVAGRQRDWEFAEEALRHGIVESAELLRRVPDLPLPAQAREHLEVVLASVVARAGGFSKAT
ncbi:MAG TPA: DUF6036 family nucleotidyltransferase [Solirubrobacteraceae bacterium]|nr:DUF6036 family nucleotidyltransferase [Solirubrobacteraceae bacterium]